MYAQDVIRNLQEDAWYEVERQEELWGVQTHPDGTGTDEYIAAAEAARNECNAAHEDDEQTYALILLEEIFEALAETDPIRLLLELTQAQAVILSWQRAILTRQR